MAPSTSRGGPHTCGPASCIAPYPIRFKVIEWPGSVKVPPRFICIVIMFLLYSSFVSAASFLFRTIAFHVLALRLREDLVSQTSIAECASHLFLIKTLEVRYCLKVEIALSVSFVMSCV